MTAIAGGLPYIVKLEETGLIVKRNDHEALAVNAVRLLEDRKLAGAIARRAREVCSRYHWPWIKEEWLSAYRSLALRGKE
ncbi:MAG: hypothetical protein J2P21_12660 [Chloracidobacterium sp.]|nr:hypothetical protein [Chloracidobacterium sp.]